jgi:DNA methylase/ParB-like nuclease domain
VNLLRNCPEFKHLSIDSVHPYKNHARRHPKSQLEKLKALIRHFGQVVPIIVDDQNVIVDGHAIWQAQRELDADEVMVVTVVGRDQADLRALRLALNRIAEEAVWNKDALQSELRELVNLSFDLDLTGFDAIEIDHILEIDLPLVGEATDVIPALQQAAVSVPGDIWLCGRHRIGCGDPRDAQFAGTVCGTRAAMAFLDLTYITPIEGSVTDNISTQQQDAEPLVCNAEIARVDFLTQLLSCLKVLCARDALIYAGIDWRHIADLLAAGRACGLSLEDLCVWGKTEASVGMLYRSQHELVCIFAASASELANKVALSRHGQKRSNLWTYRAPTSVAGENEERPIAPRGPVKPVALVADAIRDATKRGAVIVDTFLGSGTTLIAAQETGRVCMGIEHDPRHVDLAIRRWQCATQQKARHAERGETFDHCGRHVIGPSQEASRG